MTSLDTSQVTTPSVTSFWQYVESVHWFRNASLILIALATVGNSMSVITLQNPKFRKSSTSFILSVLAVVDGCVGYTGLLRLWINNELGIDVRSLTSAGCKVHVFLTYLLHQVS